MVLRTLLTIVSLLVGNLVPAAAQDNFVLVIDGSSSMWGQVGGQTKIDILKYALSDVLGQLDTDANVGVVAFGHREKGNCADIEELVPPQPFDRALIQAAIDNIQPKGKTPLSDAVRFAAEELRFTEERATVVILGDGGENCAKDPCAVAEELEKTGVDLTVHAIAFDIADQEGSAQLQCFANATGGLFLPVADVPELVAALQEVQKVVENPKPFPVQIKAVDRATGAVLDGPINWSLTLRDTGTPLPITDTSPEVAVDLMPGDYDLDASAGSVTASTGFTVGPGQPTTFQLALAVVRPVMVRLDPTDSSGGGAIGLPLDWTITESATGKVQTFDRRNGPVDIALMPGDYAASISGDGIAGQATFAVEAGLPGHIRIALTMPEPPQVRLLASDAANGQPSGGVIVWTFTDVASGVKTLVEAEQGSLSDLVPPGVYDVVAEAEARSGSARVTVAEAGTTDVMVVLVRQVATVRLTAVDAATGTAIAEGTPTWTFVSTATEHTIEITSVPNDGTSDLVPPDTYDVIVEVGGGYGEARVTVSSAQPTDIVVQVTMPEAPLQVAGTTFPAGSAVPVRWTFDGRSTDLVFILPSGDQDNRYPREDWRRHVGGASRSAILTAPALPGTYEVRYFSPDAGGLVHRVAVQISAAEGKIAGPATATSGESVVVEWVGPNQPGDFLFVAPLDWGDNEFPLSDAEHVPLTVSGTARVQVPEREGSYEYRYFSAGGGGVLFRAPVLVVMPGARVSAPETVVAGDAFKVEFSGPRDKADRLFIAAAGSDPERYTLAGEAIRAVQRGSPALLVAPVHPGNYEVRYFSRDKGGLLAVAPLSVTDPHVEIEAPRLIQRASDLAIRVKGPMAPGDILFIAPNDWKDNAYPLGDENQLSFGPQGDANADDDGYQTFATVAPAKAGVYEVRYFSWANGDVLYRRALVVK